MSESSNFGGPFRVVKIWSVPGGAEQEVHVPAKFETQKAAIHIAEQVQAGCLDACEPVAVFVLDKTGIRVYAAKGDWRDRDDAQRQEEQLVEERPARPARDYVGARDRSRLARRRAS